MVSPNRLPEKKFIDAADFIDVVRHNRDQIDLAKLKRLGDKVYPNGGAEILRIVEDIDAGRKIEL
jgi:transposase